MPGLVPFAPEYREFHRFGPRRRLGGSEKEHEISSLRANSLRILTGNFLRPCRELNRAIREVSAVIRESRLPPAIWRSPLVTNPIIGAVGPVARARVHRAHRRWGIEGSNLSLRRRDRCEPDFLDQGRSGPNGARAGVAPRWRLLGNPVTQ